MKKMQKVLSIILSVVLVLSLCVTAPVTASAKRPSPSNILDSIIRNGTDKPVAVIGLLSNIITIMLTIDGLNVSPDYVDKISQALEEAKPIINGKDVTELQIQTSLIRLTNVYYALVQYVKERPSGVLPPQTLLIMCEVYRMAISSGMAGAMTEDEIALLENAMKKAEAVANDPSATQEDIERSMEELAALFGPNEDPTGPTDPYNTEQTRRKIREDIELYSGYLDLYRYLMTDEELGVLKNAIGTLSGILAKDVITEDDYNQIFFCDEAVYWLFYNGEFSRFSKDGLKFEIDRAREYIGSGLCPEEIKGSLKAAINAAQLVYSNDEATKEELVEAYNGLHELLPEQQDPGEDPTGPTQAPAEKPTSAGPTEGTTKATVPVPTNGPAPTPTAAPTSTGGKGDVSTGDNSAAVVMTLSLVMLAAAFVAASKRKEEII